MTRISECSLRLVIAVLLWLVPGTALAADVTIAYYDSSLGPLSQRLSSELASEGYQVHLEGLPAEPGCESYVDDVPPARAGFERVRIHLGRVPGSQDAACAAILYSTPSGVRQAHATASITDVARFSIRVAEALNGLRTRILANVRELNAKAMTPARDVSREADRARPRASLGASATALLDARHPSPLLGVGVLAKLPVTADWKLQFDSAWMIRSLSLEERNTQLEARLAWTRLGVALRILPDPTELDLVAGAGAAFTWVTARADSPDVGRAAVATSAMFSAGGLFAYPSDAAVHAYLALGATTIVPAVRFALPSGLTSPFGNLLGESAIGLRGRW